MTKYTVTRDVPADDPHNFVGRAVKAGETFTEARGPFYGCIDFDYGVAVDVNGSFREFPRDAVEARKD